MSKYAAGFAINTNSVSKRTNAKKKSKAVNFAKRKKELSVDLKYHLYTCAVQDPKETVKTIDSIFTQNFKKNALSIREDFCGTFLVGCEWIKSSANRKAVGIDLGAEPLKYADNNISNLLDTQERARAILHRQDVRIPTLPRVDVIIAENFSFYVLQKRAELVSYFRTCLSSLEKEGLLILDMIGGREFTATPRRDVKPLKKSETKLASNVFYRWTQRSFNPVTNNGQYSIDFKIKNKWHNEVFQYDWRVWTIPEVKEALVDAGFDEVLIYWDDEKEKRDSLKAVQKISNQWDTWLCNIVAVKRKK